MSVLLANVIIGFIVVASVIYIIGDGPTRNFVTSLTSVIIIFAVAAVGLAIAFMSLEAIFWTVTGDFFHFI